MNIVSSLTLRHMKLNKKRTIITIIGVIISTAMLTAVTVSIPSLRNMMYESTVAEEGGWHYMLQGVSADKLQIINDDESVEASALMTFPDAAKAPGIGTKESPYLSIDARDSRCMEYEKPELLDGRFPENDSEIMIAKSMNTMNGTDIKPGDKLSMTLGQLSYSEDDDSEAGEVLKDDSGNETEETFTPSGKKTYTVTGIVTRFRSGYGAGVSSSFSAVSGLAPGDIKNHSEYRVYITSKVADNQLYQKAEQLADKLGINSDDIDYHRSLLRFLGTSQNGDLVQTLYMFAGIMYLIIIFGSVSLIYNAFAISLTERSRYLGMLASVGATRAQKRQSVFFESFLIGIIGIPLGIASGLLGMGITFRLVGPAIAKLTSYANELRLSFPPAALLIIAALGALTIFISACIPARRASRLSPIDAIRKNEDEKLTRRKVKTSKLTGKLCGFEGLVALKNLKRNRRRYRATIFSLAVSIILFLSVSTFTGYLKETYRYVDSNSINYDVSIYTPRENSEMEKYFAKDLNSLKNVEKQVHSMVYTDAFLVKNSDMDPEMPSYAEIKEGYHTVTVSVQSLDDKSLKELAKKSGADYKALKDPGKRRAIVNKYCMNTRGEKNVKRTLIPSTSIKKGGTLTLSHFDDTGEEGGVTLGDEVPFTIAAFTEEYPLGGHLPQEPDRLELYVSEETLPSFIPEEYFASNFYYLTSKQPEKLEEELTGLEKIYGSFISVTNVMEERRQQEQLMTSISVFSYGFIVLITMICIANILNTIATSFALREREFAMLKSVGMSEKQFRKMIRFESFFYGFKALIYGLPLSFAVMLLMHRTLAESMEQPFYLPVVPLIIVVAALFLIVGISMAFAASRLKGKSLVESLRDNN